MKTVENIKLTHYDRILNHLIDYGSITSWEAIEEYGITRISAVIFELRKKYNIRSEVVKNKNRYGDPVHYVKYILER